MRHAIDRFVALVARAITKGLYRSVEVAGFDDLPDGPRLIVANHFNGFVDPVVLAGALGRLPRFIAKATLWKTPGVPILMKLVGVLPVHRSADGGGDNSGTFSSVVAQLHKGHAVAIFPEGTTHDNQQMSTVRTGAARLALDAAHDGVAGMHIVPVGLTFEDKVALRSRVVVRAGTPIDPAGPAYRAADGSPVGSDDHAAVRDLTEEIRSSLAAVSPDFESLLDSVELRAAADVVLRRQGVAPLGEVSLAEREALAAELDELPEPDQRAIGAAVAEYQLLLTAIGIRDDHVVPKVGLRQLVLRAVVVTVALLVILPFAFAGMVVNLIPALLVIAAGAVATAPVSKGTNRVLAGVVAFPLAWGLLAVKDVGSSATARVLSSTTSPLTPFIEAVFGDRGGWGPSVLVFLACPLLGLLAVWLVERVTLLWRTWRAVTININRRGQLRELLEKRTEVEALIASRRTAAVTGSGDGGGAGSGGSAPIA